jgi:hypothetical protein
MLFDFFKKKVDNELNDNIIAKVSYIITSNSDSPIVDVELESYDNNSIKALCSIVDILSHDKCITDTCEIIQSAMIEDGNSDNVVKFFSYLDIKTKNKLINIKKYADLDEPCIKPSDAFIK